MKCSVRASLTLVSLALVSVAAALAPTDSAQARLFYGTKLVDRYQAAVVFSRVIHRCGEWPNLDSLKNESFTDVPNGYRLPVCAVASLGIMPAFEGRFEGKRPVLRYELAMYLQRLLRALRVAPAGPDTPLDAVDLPGGHVADDAAREAVRRGLIKPYGRKFDGHKVVDRYEFAGVGARLARLLQLTRPAVEADFEDVPAGHPALPDIAACLSAGLLSVDATGSWLTPEAARRERAEALARLAAQPGPPVATPTPPPTPAPKQAARPTVRPVAGSSRPVQGPMTPKATPKPRATAAPKASPAPKATATPEATPAPEAAPTPEATPTPDDDDFSVGM